MSSQVENIRVIPWDEQVLEAIEGCHALFNSRVYAQANQLEGHEPFVLEVNENRYLGYKRHASAVLGGLSLGDEVALLENIPALKSMLEPIGIRNISLNTLNAPGDVDALARAVSLGCKVRFEYMLDLEEYLPNKISSNHKRNIKKSEKASAKVTFPAELEAMQSHIEIVNTNLGNKGVGGISSSAEFFRYLVQGESGLLVQVIENGETLASTYFVINKDCAYYHSSGTSDRGKKVGAAHFLVDRMIVAMRERNMRYLNLGGCTSEQVGLQRFKVGFRPQTRVLGSISQQLSLSGKQKIRAILSTKPKDICRVERVNVYRKSVSDLPPVSDENYIFEEKSWADLVSAIAEAPGFSENLEQFCRSNSSCYALTDQQHNILAIGFIDAVQEGGGLSPAKNTKPQDIGEITHLQFGHSALEGGVAALFIGFLEQEARASGYRSLVRRVDSKDVQSQELLSKARFSFVGQERIVSTLTMGGRSTVFGKAGN